MKQLVIISGKGGTGKTVITAAFAKLAKNKVMADCDVDAADLHLLLNPTLVRKHEFKSGQTAVISKAKCNHCGVCISACRFDAIAKEDFTVDSISCEGCGVCSHVCPNMAIKMKENDSGEWYISDTKYGPLVHAKLGIAEENSGKLVATVRKNARFIAEKEKRSLVIIDGPPGIGCPVISSITGADGVLVVTEPTLSGKHDMKRVVELTRYFKIKTFVMINKYDLNNDISKEIETYCNANEVYFAGKVSFDPLVIKALISRQNIIEYSKGLVTEQIRSIWEKTLFLLR